MQYNIKLVSQWAHDRGLTDQTNDALRSQFIKGVEEGGEIFEAILKRDKDLLVDAIGDELVVLTIMCINAGLDPVDHIKRVRCEVIEPLNKFNSFDEAVKSRDALEHSCQYGALQGRLARAIAKQQPIEKHVDLLIHKLNHLSRLLCVDIGECYRTAYNEIKNRTGRKVDGVFVKDE